MLDSKSQVDSRLIVRIAATWRIVRDSPCVRIVRDKPCVRIVRDSPCVSPCRRRRRCRFRLRRLRPRIRNEIDRTVSGQSSDQDGTRKKILSRLRQRLASLNTIKAANQFERIVEARYIENYPIEPTPENKEAWLEHAFPKDEYG